MVFLTVQYNRKDRIAILPARNRGISQLGGIVGSFLSVANLNQSSSEFIRAPNFYFIGQFC